MSGLSPRRQTPLTTYSACSISLRIGAGTALGRSFVLSYGSGVGLLEQAVSFADILFIRLIQTPIVQDKRMQPLRVVLSIR